MYSFFWGIQKKEEERKYYSPLELDLCHVLWHGVECNGIIYAAVAATSASMVLITLNWTEISLSHSLCVTTSRIKWHYMYVVKWREKKIFDRQMQMLFSICNGMELKQMFQSSKRCFLPRRNSTLEQIDTHERERESVRFLHHVQRNKLSEWMRKSEWKKIIIWEIIFRIRWSFVCISMSHTIHHRHTFNKHDAQLDVHATEAIWVCTIHI